MWSEPLWPREYPLATNEMSILLPHFLKDGRGRLEVYFSRVYNPLWVNPDGFTWIDVLKDEAKIGLHVALTPTWSESATFADYVLPMGHAAERHDTMSFETHTSKWVAFRQPVRRVAMERLGMDYHDSRDANPGEVWEENEFWFDLSWRIDPDGSLGIRRYFESRERPGEKMTRTSTTGSSSRPVSPGCRRRRRPRSSPRWRTCASTASSRWPRTSTGSTSGS